jgi:hypothetical protein
MDLVAFRALVTMGVGGFLFLSCLGDIRRGVTLFNLRRARSVLGFWLMVLVQLCIFGAIFAYGLAQYRIARGLMAPLGFAGLYPVTAI